MLVPKAAPRIDMYCFGFMEDYKNTKKIRMHQRRIRTIVKLF